MDSIVDTNSTCVCVCVKSLPHREVCLRFANRAGPDKAALIRVYCVCLWKYDISDPTLVDLTSNFFVPFTNMKVYLYNFS